MHLNRSAASGARLEIVWYGDDFAVCTGEAGGCLLLVGVDMHARALFCTGTRALALCVYVCVAPGNCDASTSVGTYYRKHNPLISFDSVRNNATRCAKIVNSDQLDKDLAGAVLCALCRLHFVWPATRPFSVLCLVFLMLPGCQHR